MKDKIFIDTNVFVYFLLEDEKQTEKRKEARKIIKYLLNKEIVISVQVLNEIYYVLSKKYKISEEIIKQKLELIISKTKLIDTNIATIRNAWEIKSIYKYSYWDSLIISSALQAKCSILLTEDLHKNQIIEDNLKIINPFRL